MKVAVTGGTGLVGRFIVQRLLADGVEARALVRPDSTAAPLPGAVESVVGDMTEPPALTRLVAGADAVVHCAFEHAPGRYRGGEGTTTAERLRFWRANLLAGVELMECARLAGAGRCILLSSRAVFGHRSGDGEGVDDDTRPIPDTHYGALKLALEAHAAAFSDADGLCCASLRPTGVYGIAEPVERSKWFDLGVALAKGEPLPPARLATEVHGRDVADAVSLLLNAPAEQVAARTFNCSDLVLDTRRVMAGIATRLGVDADLPPPATNPLGQAMRALDLGRLGWQPGGEQRLEATLDALAGALRHRL